MDDIDLLRRFEEGKKKHAALNDRAIRVRAESEMAGKRLVELNKKAVETFGTSDPVEIQKKIDEVKALNQQKAMAFLSALAESERLIASAEQVQMGL